MLVLDPSNKEGEWKCQVNQLVFDFQTIVKTFIRGKTWMAQADLGRSNVSGCGCRGALSGQASALPTSLDGRLWISPQ